MITNTCSKLRYIIPVIASAFVAVSSLAEKDEVHVYGIGNFGGSSIQCGEPDQAHPVHTSTAAAFLVPFVTRKANGLWDQVSTRNNWRARGTYWTDATKNSAGDDIDAGDGVDDADVIYVHTHGSHSTWPFASSTLLMGNKTYECRVRTDGHMLFGNGAGDLEIAVIKACQSGDYDTFMGGGYRQQFTKPESRFTVWNAFHGDSSCGDHVTQYVGDYAAASFTSGIGENWLDEAYDGAGDDDCPVSIVMGSNASKRDDMYEYGGFRDRKNTGNKTGSTYYFIGGCHPKPDTGRTLPE